MKIKSFLENSTFIQENYEYLIFWSVLIFKMILNLKLSMTKLSQNHRSGAWSSLYLLINLTMTHCHIAWRSKSSKFLPNPNSILIDIINNGETSVEIIMIPHNSEWYKLLCKFPNSISIHYFSFIICINWEVFHFFA